MKKRYLIIIGILLVGTITAALSLGSFDDKLKEIYTEGVCRVENSLSLSSKQCDKDTPEKIDVDFEIDKKTNLIKVTEQGIYNSVNKKEEK